MGADEGFDLYPPLRNTPADNRLYAAFVAAVREEFKNDPVMQIDDEGRTVFRVGESPSLCRDAQYFRRFSAKITGSHCKNVQDYLHSVRVIAVKFFGNERVHYWNELWEHGFPTPYSWEDVHDANDAQRSS